MQSSIFERIFLITESGLEFFYFQLQVLVIDLQNVVCPSEVSIGLSMFVVLFHDLSKPFLLFFSLLFGRSIFLGLGTYVSFQVVDSLHGSKLMLSYRIYDIL